MSTAETEDMKDTSASTSDMLSSVSNVLTPTSNANAASSALSVCAAEISMNRYVSAVSPSVSGCSVDPEYLEPGKSESGTNGNFGSDRLGKSVETRLRIIRLGPKLEPELTATRPRTARRAGAHKLPLWRGAAGGGVLAGTRRQSAAGDGVPPSLQIPPHTHILLARSPAPYSPFRRRTHSPTAFSGPMARPTPSPPRPLPLHMHAGWMVSATKTPTSSAPSQGRPF